MATDPDLLSRASSLAKAGSGGGAGEDNESEYELESYYAETALSANRDASRFPGPARDATTRRDRRGTVTRTTTSTT